jgi:hypothetical protein
MTIATHIENFLGQMHGGASSNSLSGVYVCEFRDQPEPGVTTFATLGLSSRSLALPDGTTIRQEVVVALRGESVRDSASRVTMHVAWLLARDGRALRRGEVVPFGEPLTTSSHVHHFYATSPVVFPDGFDLYEGSTPATIVVWLIPVLPSEVAAISADGWERFEDRLEAADLDIFDIERPAIVTGP